MARRFYWNELTSPEFAALDAETTIAILPVASTEQHGPHLPISTDVTIANGMIAEVRTILPDHLDVLVLPTQEALVRGSANVRYSVSDRPLIWLLPLRLGNERISGVHRQAFGSGW